MRAASSWAGEMAARKVHPSQPRETSHQRKVCLVHGSNQTYVMVSPGSTDVMRDWCLYRRRCTARSLAEARTPPTLRSETWEGRSLGVGRSETFASMSESRFREVYIKAWEDPIRYCPCERAWRLMWDTATKLVATSRTRAWLQDMSAHDAAAREESCRLVWAREVARRGRVQRLEQRREQQREARAGAAAAAASVDSC